MTDENIKGAKLILFLGGQLVVLRRDDKPDIVWPDHLDLPGGGREPGESAAECVLRETWEEIGLRIAPEQLIYRRDYQRANGCSAFFGAELGAELIEQIKFGDEGQGWMMMRPDEFAEHPEAVPHFRDRLKDYLAFRGALKSA